MNRLRFGNVVAGSLLAIAVMSATTSAVRGDVGCGVVMPVGGCGPVFSWGQVCGPRWGGWCQPGWGAGYGWGGCRPICPPPVWCAPACIPDAWTGSWCGVPAWNSWGGGWGGWYGGTTWSFRNSVFLSVPAGGRMTFFSGSIVPTPWYGYASPCGNVFGWTPWLGAATRPGMSVVAAGGSRPAVVGAVVPPARQVIARAPRGVGRSMAIRASTALSRARAARLVARGDAQLRDAGRDRAGLEAALASYRQAVVVAHDQPDALIRQALVLEALDRRAASTAALDQAVAVDGRLATMDDVAGRAVAADPIFDGGSQAGLPPVAARGVAILREIGAEAVAGGEPPVALAWLADRWSARWGRGMNAVAAHGP